MKKAFLIVLICSLFSVVQAQEIEVTGTVKDASDGVTLPGVSVLSSNKSVAITDIDGNYSIKVNKGESLTFTFIGMKPQTIKVGDSRVIDVTLAYEAIGLEGVVAIGYGVQKKKLVTGANMNMDGETISEQNTATAMDALKGIAPGVNITQNTAAPGASTKVSIRGIGTTGNSTPTFVVDGVVQGNIDYLSPSDIESIDVFKDAASAAIYGNRGANGVIYVTTKKGRKSERPTITYDGYYGVQNVYKSPDLLTAQQYIDIMHEQEANSGHALTDFSSIFTDYDGGDGTNWFEEMRVKNAPIQNHSLGIQGGSELSTYSIGLSYFDQDGVFGKQSDAYYKRTTVRMNSDHILWKEADRSVITFGQNLTYSNSKSNAIRSGNTYWNDVRASIVANPLMPIYDADGNYTQTYDAWDIYGVNAAGQMEYLTKYNENDNNTASGNFYLDIQAIKNLTWRTRVGFNMWWGDNRGYVPTYNLGGNYSRSNPQVTQGAWNGRTLMHDNTLTYKFDINKEHNFELMAGNSVEKNVRSVEISGQNNNFIFDDWGNAYLSNTSTTVDGASPVLNGKDNYGWGMLSYFGRLTYNYKETWMFSALIRADGSSRFTKDNRWGYFPSVSAGYVLTNAPFMESIVDKGVLDFFKIRASWGQLGNESVSSFLFSSTLKYNADNGYNNWAYSFGDPTSMSTGSMPARIPNPDLTWETSEQLDFGFDAYLLNSRMTIAFDWYRKDTKDWLVSTDVPGHNGLTTMAINGGGIRNQGVEIALNWKDNIGDFNYGAGVSFANNKNKVTEIANSEGIIHGPANALMQGMGEMFRAEVGMPIGYFWGLQTDGIIQNEAEADAWLTPDGNKYFEDQQPGDFRFVDQNGDGLINDDDKVMIGNPNPDVILGIQLDAEYKGFFLNTTLNGAFGHQIAKAYRNFTDGAKANYTTDVFNRWHGEGTSNDYPRIDMESHRNTQYMSDFYIEDGDYLKISNLTFGYEFKNLLNLPFLGSAKLYLQARNLYTFTGYSGLDPEVGYGYDAGDYSGSWSSGIDLGLYPASRTYLMGISLKF